MKKIISILLVAILLILMFSGCTIKEKTLENVNFAILPDTQLYADIRPEIFYSQVDWIVENKENIDYVLHVGDIINKVFDFDQWKVAEKAMDKLAENGIPYIVSSGNHDVDYSSKNLNMNKYYDDNRENDVNFIKYFGVERYKDMPTYGGHSKNEFNQYHIMKAGDYEILILALDWLPSKDTLNWVERVLKKHKDKPTIVVKHEFIKPINDKTTEFPKFSSDASKEQWEILKKYNQVFMVVNGHHSGVSHGTIKNNAGNDVFLMVVDYQNKARGGNGWMRIMNLDFENNLIKVKAFSPYLEDLPKEELRDGDEIVLLDEQNDFEFSFALKDRFIN